MSYYHDLAFELRMRGQSEERVEEILREVEDFVRSAGGAPEDEFGSAADFATRYAKRRRVTAGHWIFMPAIFAAIVLYIASLLLFDSGGPAVRPWVMGISLVVLVAAATAVATMVNRRLPRSFHRSGRNHRD